MTKNNPHGPGAVVRRLSEQFGIPETGTPDRRFLVTLLSALQPGDILPNGLEVGQGWHLIDENTPKDGLLDLYMWWWMGLSGAPCSPPAASSPAKRETGMTKNNPHSQTAVITRCTDAAIEQHNQNPRTLGVVSALNALQPGDILPNGLEAGQGWQEIETARKDGNSGRAIWVGSAQRMEPVHYRFGKWINCYTDTAITWEPDCWHPLPSPPAKTKERCHE